MADGIVSFQIVMRNSPLTMSAAPAKTRHAIATGSDGACPSAVIATPQSAAAIPQPRPALHVSRPAAEERDEERADAHRGIEVTHCARPPPLRCEGGEHCHRDRERQSDDVNNVCPNQLGPARGIGDPFEDRRDPARFAPSAGGIDRIAEIATREKPNVAASTANVNPKPSVAMHTPASAGPPICAVVPRSEVSADTAGRSSIATSLGVSDSSAGVWNPFTADMHAATTKRSATLGCGRIEFTASVSDPHISSVSDQRSSRRRSIASASAPPQSAVNAERDQLRRAEQTDDPRGLRERVDLHRECDVREKAPERADELSGVYEAEVAVPAERREVEEQRASTDAATRAR